MAEKRVTRRIEVSFPVTIYEAVNQAKIGDGSMFNMSMFGAGVMADITMGVGSILLLEFKLPKYTGFEIILKSKVEVRWQGVSEKCSHYGVRFINLDPLTKSRLRDFIDKTLNKRKYVL